MKEKYLKIIDNLVLSTNSLRGKICFCEEGYCLKDSISNTKSFFQTSNNRRDLIITPQIFENKDEFCVRKSK